ncbi:MAG: type-F conjugative transfer system secretin TraK [Burkholderiaceae bacterium]|nr:type-F conjugative transfer system secretin TraK [Burkholderiaceae bacterium]
MARPVKLASALLIPALWFAELRVADALQVVEATDGVTVEAVLAIKEPTRIRIDGASITNVFGNIYSSNCGAAVSTQPGTGSTPVLPQINPAGEIVLECDADKGEIYVRPIGGTGGTGGLGKPVNLFISSQHATYTLLLRRSDTPADTIVIRDRTPRQARADHPAAAPALRQSVHIRSLKAMLVAMASDRVPTDVRVEEVDRPIQLWVEARFALTRMYEGRGLIGERYLLTNISSQNMVLAEQEFDRDTGAVLAVSIENHNLRPGDSTTVFVIRQGV